MGSVLMTIPVIQTAQLTLQPLHEADFVSLYAIQCDPQAMQYTYTAPSFAAFEVHLRAYIALESTIGYGPWAIRTTATATLCGWGGLSIDPFAAGWGVEVFYFLAPNVWGRGYATELVNASLRYGFATLSLPVIGAFSHQENRASSRVLEKCGFRFLGYEPKLDRNRYEMRNEWWTDHA
jgi:RimJ/RimL family protein N-acetyltransferase